MLALDVNPAYEAWKLSTGKEKEWALHVLIQRLERFATAICWRRLPDHRNEFGPLVNGIVWRAIKNVEKFKAGAKFSTWFYTIVVNECNRYLRNYKRRIETSLEEEAVAPSTDAAVDLIGLLDTLEGDEHLLFRLVAEGQDFKCIASMLKISRNAAFVRWSRLKEKLRNAK